MAVSPKDQNIAFAYLVPVLSEMMQSSYTELPAGHGVSLPYPTLFPSRLHSSITLPLRVLDRVGH